MCASRSKNSTVSTQGEMRRISLDLLISTDLSRMGMSTPRRKVFGLLAFVSA